MATADRAAPRVLLLYQAMIPSLELCARAPLLDAQARGLVALRCKTPREVTRGDLCWADSVILGRSDTWFERKIAEKLRAAGKTLLYILDDDLFHVPAANISYPHYHSRQTQDDIRRMIALSHALISPSPRLLELYTPRGAAPILIEEPALLKTPFIPAEPGAPVKLGFAGSLDRQADVERLLKDALVSVKRRYGDRVSIAFFGFAPSFAGQIGAEIVPYCDSYAAYLSRLGSLRWDIGLAPMPDTPFHACKHYIKLVEYASAGVVSVCSDAQPYRRMRERTDAAVFCGNTAEEWARAVGELIDQPERRERMRRAAYDMARTQFNVSAVADVLAREIGRLPRDGAQQSPRVSLSLLRAVGLWHRLTGLWRAHGVKLPAVALRKLLRRLGR